MQVAASMLESFSIGRHTEQNPPDIQSLVQPSLDERQGLVRRALDDWIEGVNRFEKDGEAFLVARINNEVVGMCGLNVDPFLDDPTVGRIRHLYVLPERRRNGIGKLLVGGCIDLAEGTFARLRLRTFEATASAFYESLGFERTTEETATHSMNL